MNRTLTCVFFALALGCGSVESGDGPLQSQLAGAAAAWAKDKPACSTYHYH